MTASPIGQVIEIVQDGRHLAKDRGFLTVNERGLEVGRVPLDDIVTVIATSPATTVTCALLSELAERGVPFVLCGRNHVPTGLLWPVAGHHAQQRRMEAQMNASQALRDTLWRLLVAAKIRAQATVLDRNGQGGGPLHRMARTVTAGDPENREAQAARRYWPLLMGPDFRRDIEADGINALLNYGYAVLRAATARAIAGAGLHPGIGIFHRHPHNPMPLADDLMEPFRPLVDHAVLTLAHGGIGEVTPDAKRSLVAMLLLELPTAAGRSPVTTCLVRLAASLADSFMTGHASLELPAHPTAGDPERPDDDALSG